MAYTYTAATATELQTMAGALPLEILRVAGKIPSTDKKTRAESPYLPGVSFGYDAANKARKAVALCSENLSGRTGRHVALEWLAAAYYYMSVKAPVSCFPDAEIVEDVVSTGKPADLLALAEGVKASKQAHEKAAAALKAKKAADAEAARIAAESSTGNTSGEPRVPTATESQTVTVATDSTPALPSVSEVIAAIHLLKGHLTREEYDALAVAVMDVAPVTVTK